MNVILYDKRYLAEVSKDLEMQKSFRITQVDSKCYHKCPYKREAEVRLEYTHDGRAEGRREREI